MLGALEVKTIARVASRHGEDWKPIHSAVLGCLLAHRNRNNALCCPSRQTIAAFCNTSERTVDRTLTELRDWRAIGAEGSRSLSLQRYRPIQYSFLFDLPQVEEKPCEIPVQKEQKPCEIPVQKIEAVRQIEPSRATNSGEPCDKNATAIRKEAQRTKAQRTEGAIPPKDSNFSNRPQYTQTDFDARDWRKLQMEIRTMKEAGIGSHFDGDANAFFRTACMRSGISSERGNSLWKKMLA